MTDLIDTRNVGAISALARAMANAIAPSNMGGASLQLQDLRITFAAPPPVAALLGTADARVLRRTEQGIEVEAHLLNSLGELIASATGRLEFARSPGGAFGSAKEARLLSDCLEHP